MYYAYNVTADNQLLQSSDGVTWQQITNNTALDAGAIILTNVVQVSGSVFAAVDDLGGLYLGSSPANMTFISASAIVPGGFIAANGTGSLYISNNDVTTAANLKIYTPTASALGQSIANSAAFTNIPNALIFAGNNIYSVDSQNGNLSALTVSGPTITQATNPASLVDATGAIASQLTTNNSVGASTNGYFAMGSNVLALNTNTSSTGAAGAIAMISGVAANGALTYNNLPTGDNVSANSFAGTTNGYMLVLNNGDVLVSSANGFVQATTILNPSNGQGAALANLASANGTYLADDNNNLYYSTNNGSTWTTITPTVAGAGSGTLSISSAANGLYFITVAGSTGTLTDGLYQTATPQTLSTWVQVSSVPTQSQATYWGGTYYLLGYGAALNNTNVGVYNPVTGQIVANDNVLPQSTNGENISYNGSTFALAQLNSNYLWTSTNLLAGPSAWTQNVATFTGVNGVSVSAKFSGSLTWNGKVWVATVTAASLTLGNLGTPAQANLYTAKDFTAFVVGTYTSTTGVTTAVSGSTTGLF